MRNPGGKGLSRVHPAPFRKGRRGRRVAAKPRLKPARSRESRQKRDLESEGIALPAGPGASPKTGGGQAIQFFLVLGFGLSLCFCPNPHLNPPSKIIKNLVGPDKRG